MDSDARNLSVNLAEALKGVCDCITEAKAIYEGISGAEATEAAHKDIGSVDDIVVTLLDHAASLASNTKQLFEWLRGIRGDLGLPGPDPVAFVK